MDKLQPLIKHRYWICFAFAVIFVLVGWWMASGAIAVEILARTSSVEDSFKKAEQNKTDPNSFWVEQAKKKNEADESSYKSASSQLLQRQKEARQWPEVLKSDFQGIAYRDDVKDKTARARWASIYRDEIERLLEIVKPFKNGEGLVVIDSSKITHKPFNSWRTGPPASTEIWNCQEDIWLLRSLLTSIARVNDGATRITESQVRQIFKLTLRGGDRDASPAASGGGMDSMMGSGMMGSGRMVGEMGMGVGGGIGDTGGTAAASYPGKEFEGSAGADILTEEFGAFAAEGAGEGMGMGAMGMGSMGMGSMGMGSMGMTGGELGGAAASAEEKRYVDDGEQLGYKTRAFLLDVTIRDDQIPNLLASLTNSDFPVEIVRVEVTSNSSQGQQGMGGAEMGSGMMSDMGLGGLGEDSGELGFGMDSGVGGLGIGATEPGLMGSSGFGDAGMQGIGSGMMPGGMMGGSDKGNEALQIAMADPLLVHVKIGGLMTLYQSAQEADAEAATAEIDQANAPAAVPSPDGTGAMDGADSVEPSGASGENLLPADGAVKPEDAAEGDGPGADASSSDEPSTSGSPPVSDDPLKGVEPAAELPATSTSELPPSAESSN